MTQEQQSAFDLMREKLREYDLESLAPVLQQLIIGGIVSDAQLELELRETDEWKQRFAGNEMRKAAGKNVLSVEEYLAAERSYEALMREYGLPPGFYDQKSDFAKWIGTDVSPTEVQGRFAAYKDLANREDPAVVGQLASMGLSEGDVLAHLVDPTRAWPLIERKYKQALVGAAARRRGLTADNDYLGHLVDLGVTEQQAVQGYGAISEQLPTMQKLGALYGEQMGQKDLEAEVFEQDGDAARKRKRLASRERAQFQGSAGTGQGSLGRRTSGSY